MVRCWSATAGSTASCASRGMPPTTRHRGRPGTGNPPVGKGGLVVSEGDDGERVGKWLVNFEFIRLIDGELMVNQCFRLVTSWRC